MYWLDFCFYSIGWVYMNRVPTDFVISKNQFIWFNNQQNYLSQERILDEIQRYSKSIRRPALQAVCCLGCDLTSWFVNKDYLSYCKRTTANYRWKTAVLMYIITLFVSSSYMSDLYLWRIAETADLDLIELSHICLHWKFHSSGWSFCSSTPIIDC